MPPSLSLSAPPSCPQPLQAKLGDKQAPKAVKEKEQQAGSMKGARLSPLLFCLLRAHSEMLKAATVPPKRCSEKPSGHGDAGPASALWFRKSYPGWAVPGQHSGCQLCTGLSHPCCHRLPLDDLARAVPGGLVTSTIPGELQALSDMPGGTMGMPGPPSADAGGWLSPPTEGSEENHRQRALRCGADSQAHRPKDGEVQSQGGLHPRQGLQYLCQPLWPGGQQPGPTLVPRCTLTY